jgi:hypothetical protein
VDLRYEVATNSTGRIHPWQNSSAISGHPDIPCFLLLDDPANELFLSAGLGAGRILTSIGGSAKASCVQLKLSQNLLSLDAIFFLVN